MKKEQINKINDSLLKKTGVDFSHYRNEELTDTIANAVTFPLYFARSISRPVGLLLLTTIVAIALADSGFFKTFLVFPGLVLAIINGVLLGLVIFIRRIRNDMDTVFNISADISLQVMRDIGAARSNVKAGAIDFPSLLEIFQGVNAIIILPVVVRILNRKIPFFGGVATRITKKFFGVVDSRLASAVKAKSAAGKASAAPLSPQDVSAWLQSAERMVDFGKNILSQVVDKVAWVVAFPFLTVFTIVSLISATILYGGYVMIG